jgi:hypothetical protein
MKAILERRQAIYDYFQNNSECKKYFYDGTHKIEYVTYYNSMYLLQDSTESLFYHRNAGFSTNPHNAYLEFWGVMQAVIIQQDAIAEIFNVLTRRLLGFKTLTSWEEARSLRNICAGHPVKKDRPKTEPLTRSFMSRNFGGYGSITYEQWQEGVGISHPQVRLGALLDAYSIEAEEQLAVAYTAMKARWP